MKINYDLSAVEILKLLGYSRLIGKDNLLKAERENNLKLPSALFEFWSLTADCPLFKTADIRTGEIDSFWFFYDDIQEWIDDDKDYYENTPPECIDDEHYEFYKLPKEQWNSRVPNYLQIGSDYGAGVAVFGICLDEIGQDDPPVYGLIEGDSLSDWQTYDDCLSDFLMRSLCDVLSCKEYDTAIRVMKKMGWTVKEVHQEDFPELDMNLLLKYKSTYGANAVCGCAYDEEKKLLLSAVIDKENSSNRRIMTYEKNEQL